VAKSNQEGNALTAYFKGTRSLFLVPFGNQLSLPSFSSNGYYIGIALTAHNNSDSNMASSQVSKVDLFRACTNESTTPECDQSTNVSLDCDQRHVMTQEKSLRLVFALQ
jgi:hypothetical protein